jgi:penicillin amidase
MIAGLAGALMLAATASAAAEVEIVRDRYGVPHVYAATTHDLFLGYGYAVAEDRLFQMEMAKRSFTGRVAEVLGADYVAHDTMTRQLSSPERIQRQIEELGPDDRAILGGYAAGVNRRIAEVLGAGSRARLLPKQFLDRGFEPEPWSELDVAMIFVGTMANRFSDASNELNNLALLRALESRHGKERALSIFAQMFWPGDPLAPTTTTDRSADPYQPARIAWNTDHLRGHPKPMLAGAPGLPLEPATASNMMIVGARKAAGAQALLLNGPQFSSFNPAYVYAIGLHGAGFDVVGNTPFAYPVLLFAHNGRIAWGSTAGASHVVDIYEEQLDPADPTRYRFQGSYRDMERRVDTIRVKAAEPVTLEVFRTVHGLVVQRDATNGVAYARKRSWEGREIASLLAWIRLDAGKGLRRMARAGGAERAFHQLVLRRPRRQHRLRLLRPRARPDGEPSAVAAGLGHGRHGVAGDAAVRAEPAGLQPAPRLPPQLEQSPLARLRQQRRLALQPARPHQHHVRRVQGARAA